MFENEDQIKNDFSRLSDDQKQFIINKVRELGTIEKVRIFYNLNCVVDRFAREISKTLLANDEVDIPIIKNDIKMVRINQKKNIKKNVTQQQKINTEVIHKIQESMEDRKIKATADINSSLGNKQAKGETGSKINKSNALSATIPKNSSKKATIAKQIKQQKDIPISQAEKERIG